MRTSQLFCLVAVISLVLGACGKPLHKPNETKHVSNLQKPTKPDETKFVHDSGANVETGAGSTINSEENHKTDEPTPLPPENELSWANVSARVFAVHCAGCHKKYVVYEKVKKDIEYIDNAVFVMGTMPKEGALTEAESKLLAAWIQAGAPEKAEAPVPQPTELPPASSEDPQQDPTAP